MTKYQEFCSRKQAQYGDKFSDELLNKHFVSAFNNGDSYRVLVDYGYEKPTWGYISVTTGWKPRFLLMRRRGQHGSSYTIGADSKIIKSKWI